MWTVPLAVNDVAETTVSFVASDQLFQWRFDVIFSGTGGPVTSDDYFAQLQLDWIANISVQLSVLSRHVQTRVQAITDVVVGIGGRPKRIRGQLDKQNATTAMDGIRVGPPLPHDTTVSIALITDGSPRAFWGKKGFALIPQGDVSTDGETITPTASTAWDTVATAMFTTVHTIGATTMNYRVGLLPSTYVANQPIPHGAMSGYFYPFKGVQVGTYVGSQATRRIHPQSLKGH